MAKDKTIRLNQDAVTGAVSKVSNKIEDLNTAKSKVKSAYYKLKMDDIFSVQSLSKELYANLSSIERDLNYYNNLLENYCNAAKEGVILIGKVDSGSTVPTPNSKKSSWKNILKKYGVGVGTMLAVSPVVSAVTIGGIIFSNKNMNRNSSSSVTKIKSWKDQDGTEEKSNSVHEYYETVKAEHEQWIATHTYQIYRRKVKNLTSEMDLKQGNYHKSGISFEHEGCCAVAYAAGLKLTTGVSYDPTSLVNGSCQCTWSKGGVASYKRECNLSEIYQSVKNGKPVLFDCNGHWTLITGVNKDADVNNLTYSNFNAIDPAYGDERNLTSVYHFSSSSITGTKFFL